MVTSKEVTVPLSMFVEKAQYRAREVGERSFKKDKKGEGGRA